MKIEPGKSYRINYGEGNINNRLIHVRAIVDDYVVFREWWKRHQRWNYSIEHLVYFDVLSESGYIEEAK